MDGIDATARKGFGSAAEEYERGRPEYPPAAVELLARKLGLGPESVILDLGAGTGKWTRALAPTRAQMIAIEPVDAMREKFGLLNPKVLIAPGSAEFITLPSRSVDVVTCAQAFHWFDGPKALSEIRRVLVPGGALALVWNARDESEDWVARLGEIIDRYAGSTPRYRTGAWRRAFQSALLFTPLEQQSVRHVQDCGLETLLDRVSSISYIAALEEVKRQEVLRDVRSLVAHHPDTAGKMSFALPYRTDVYWCFVRAGAGAPSLDVRA